MIEKKSHMYTCLVVVFLAQTLISLGIFSSRPLLNGYMKSEEFTHKIAEPPEHMKNVI